jgi:hypothetical protein
MRRIWLGTTVLAVCIASGALLPAPAAATAYDFLAAGTRYTCTTYAGHANYFSSAGRAFSADIEMPEGTPIYAPEAGTVQQVSAGWGGGYGNAIVWTSADGNERFHIAHMRDVEPAFAVTSGAVPGPVVPVAPGEVIGHVGSTGQCAPADFSHMHMERSLDGRVSPVVLSGVTVDPWRAPTLVSAGPRPPLLLSRPMQRAQDLVPPATPDASERAMAMQDSAARADETMLTQTCRYCGAPVSDAFDALLGRWQTPWPAQHAIDCPVRLGGLPLPGTATPRF